MEEEDSLNPFVNTARTNKSVTSATGLLLKRTTPDKADDDIYAFHRSKTTFNHKYKTDYNSNMASQAITTEKDAISGILL